MRMLAFCDGACQPNPGPAAYGYVLCDADGTVIESGNGPIGQATNNQAEYHAAQAAATAAWAHRPQELILHLDSQLVVRQLNGLYSTRNPVLAKMLRQVQQTLNEFAYYEVKHIDREQNKRADCLASQALP